MATRFDPAHVQMTYTCEICGAELSPYEDRHYTIILEDKSIVPLVCRTCNENRPDGSISIDMTDDMGPHQAYFGKN